MLSLILVAAAPLAAPLPAADNTAQAAVKRVIDAHGGEVALKKFPASKTTSKGTISIMGLDIEFDSETLFQMPDSARTTISMNVAGTDVKVVQIYHNGKARVTANGMEPPLTDDQLADLKESAHLSRVMQLHTLADAKAYDVSVLDKTDKVGDKETFGLLVKAKGHEDVKLLFDKQTSLVVQVERKGRSPEGKVGTQTMVLAEHKKFDGIQHPTKVEMFHDGKKIISMKTSEVKHLDKIDKKEFDLSD